MNQPVFNLLNEIHNNELLLLEFNEKDQNNLKKYYNDFTFSFEIELESLQKTSPEGDPETFDNESFELTLEDKLSKLTIKNIWQTKEEFDSFFREIIDIQNNIELMKYLDRHAGLKANIRKINFESIKDSYYEQFKFLLIHDIIENYLEYEKNNIYKTKLIEVFESIRKKLDDKNNILKKNIELNMNKELFKKDPILSYKDAAQKYLPNFFKKWGNELDFVPDGSIIRGFEMKPKTYLKGYEKAIEFLDDFFEDFYLQRNLFFNEDTGFHTNIGFMEEPIEDWNLLKGVLFLNYEMALKEFKNRIGNSNVSDFKQKLIKRLKNDASKIKNPNIENIAKSYSTSDTISSLEDGMNKILRDMSTFGKYWGMNIKHSHWIEFRYPGGIISYSHVVNSISYYMYIVLLCAVPEFKRQEYLKKLFSFIAKILEGDDKNIKNTTTNERIREDILKQIKEKIKKNSDIIIKNEISTENIYGYYLINGIYYDIQGVDNPEKLEKLLDALSEFKTNNKFIYISHIEEKSYFYSPIAVKIYGTRSVYIVEKERLISNSREVKFNTISDLKSFYKKLEDKKIVNFNSDYNLDDIIEQIEERLNSLLHKRLL